MKRAIIVMALALAAGLGVFLAVRSSHKVADRSTHGTLIEAMPELAWLRKDLDLTDEQFAKVSELHASYRPVCVEMCRQIEEAHKRMDMAARTGGEVTPELEAEITEHARIHAECQTKMLRHLYRTAEVLDESQARRYLDTMLPYALDFSHSEPEGAGKH